MPVPVVAPVHPSAQAVADADARRRLPRPVPRTCRIVLLIPAHDEELGILEAMASVDAQTLLPDRRIVVSDNSTDRTVLLARSRPGWEVWETVGNTGRKGGALNQAWERMEAGLGDGDFLVTMDADTILDPRFVEIAFAKFGSERRSGRQLGGVCANFAGIPLDSALGTLQMMEYARAARINRSRRGRAPVLAGAATMFSVRALRALYRRRGHLYEPMLTEDYELTLALRVNGYDTMAPKDCVAQTDLMPTTRMLWAQRIRWYRGAFESLRVHGFARGIRSDIGWLVFSLWAAASRWLFLLALAVTVFTVGHMSFSPWLLLLFAFASFIRVVQVKDLGWKYMVIAGLMVEELYYAFFLEAVLWRSAYLAYVRGGEGHW